MHTTLNLDYQRAADKIMAEGIEDVNTRYLALASNRLTFSNASYLPMIDLLGLAFNVEDLMYRTGARRARPRRYYTKQLNPVVELMTGMFVLEGARGRDRGLRLLAARHEEDPGAGRSGRDRLAQGLHPRHGRRAQVRAHRPVQPGDLRPGGARLAFKPLYYSAAIDSRKFTAATMILDAPVVFTNADGTSYEPLNYKGKWHGRVLLRDALAHSMNVPSLKVLDGIGFDAAIQRASRMLGITDPAEIERVFPRYYPLGLGVITVSPLQMARAFATFPNEGREVVPLAIRYIEDRNGKIILEPEKELRAQASRKGEARPDHAAPRPPTS